jgi:protein-tyrosine phosphatase
MAAAVLDNKARAAGLPLTVASAGTADYHVGEGPHGMSLRVWSDAGYRYDHTASQFDVSHYDSADLILVMDESNRRNVLRLSRGPQDAAKVAYLRSYDPALADLDPDSEGERLTVPDPWGHPRAEFEAVLDMVERAVDGLLATLA